jgi:uncharacterized RDD family membrane protein YckC
MMSKLARIRRKSKQRYFNPANVDRQKALQGLRLASFGRRAGAFALDFGIVAVFLGLLKLPETLKHGAAAGGFIMDINPFHGWELLSLLIYFGLWTYFGHGQTLGKKLMRIRIVSLTHDHLTLWHSIERTLGYGASLLEGGFGFLQYFIHPNRQTVHDRIAETIVIDAAMPAVSLEPDPPKSSAF